MRGGHSRHKGSHSRSLLPPSGHLWLPPGPSGEADMDGKEEEVATRSQGMRKQESRGGSPESGLGGDRKGHENSPQQRKYSRGRGQGWVRVPWPCLPGGPWQPLSPSLCFTFPSVQLGSAASMAMFKADVGALGTPWDLCSSFVCCSHSASYGASGCPLGPTRSYSATDVLRPAHSDRNQDR